MLVYKRIQPKFGNYLTVAQAASLLGVSPSTIRNWDRSGKLKAKRHPLNGYRLYQRDDLDVVTQKIRKGHI